MFTDWKDYLIILVVFIIIDSLLFLELHFTKLGGQELKSAKVQVGVTQEVLDSAERKTGLVPSILISFEFMSYNKDKEEYIFQLAELLKRYATAENLMIDLLPYGTKEEQEEILDNLGRSKNRAKRFLSQQSSLTLPKDNLALYPFRLLDYNYVVQIQTIGEDDKVTKVDGTAITTLIVAYNLTVNENNIESGEE